MDASSKQDALKGILTVSASEILPDEWLELVKEVLGECKPYLKYLPGFEPIEKSLNWRDGYDERKTGVAVMDFPEGISQKTKCVVVSSFAFKPEGEIEGRGAQFVTHRELLLSQEGQWLHWTLKYERQVMYGLGFTSQRSGILEAVMICKFTVARDDELLPLLAQKSETGQYPGLDILMTMKGIADKDVNERTRRLGQSQWLAKQLSEIRERISN